MVRVLTRSIRQSPTLWVLGFVFIIVGIVLTAASIAVEKDHGFLSGILGHVGMALLISLLIAFLIEVGLTYRMFENGLNAIMRQTVPPKIWEEIRQHIISQPVIRHEWRLAMSIEKAGTEYISTTSLHYEIESLRDVFRHHVHHELDHNRDPITSHGRRYTEIKVSDRLLDLDKVVSRDNLHARFDVSFLGRAKKKMVLVKFSERIGETDIVSWSMTNSTIGLTVTVTAPDTLNVMVKAHHPEERLLQHTSKGHWKFQGVMLPGQGLEIRVTPKKSGTV